MRPHFTGLWRHRDFTKLWAGQTVSIFGTMLTRIALPLTALLALNSTPLQQGRLGRSPEAAAGDDCRGSGARCVAFFHPGGGVFRRANDGTALYCGRFGRG